MGDLVMSKWWVIAFLVSLLAACTPSSEVSNGEDPQITEKATEVVPTPTAIPEATPISTRVSQPTSSPLPSATISPEHDENSDQVVIMLRQEGGFVGLDITWTIYPDGRIEQESEIIGKLDPVSHRQLLKKIGESGFFDLTQKKSGNFCCDFFTFTLTVTDGERENSITMSEADPEMPESLEKVILLILQSVAVSS